MLEKYLTRESIQLKISPVNWEAAVRAGGQLLLDTGKCTSEYIEAMVQTVREMGPYMVLAPGLALAHARPENGVLEIGMSLITLETPVEFGSKANDPVELVFSFCAVDGESHVALLKDLAVFLKEDKNQNILKNATTVAEVLGAIAG